MKHLLAAVSLAMYAGLAAADNPTPINAPTLIDGTGAVVGRVVQFDSNSDDGGLGHVILLWNGHNVDVEFGKQGPVIVGSFYYTNDTCSGTPYIPSFGAHNPYIGALVLPGIVSTPGRTVWIPGAVSSASMHSQRSLSNNICTVATYNLATLKLLRMGNLNDFFTAPFHVE